MSLPKSALYINFKTLLNPVTALFPLRKPTTPTAPGVNCKTNNENLRDHKVVIRDPFAKMKHTVPTYLLHISHALNSTMVLFAISTRYRMDKDSTKKQANLNALKMVINVY